jgi:hypothetical protein
MGSEEGGGVKIGKEKDVFWHVLHLQYLSNSPQLNKEKDLLIFVTPL